MDRLAAIVIAWCILMSPAGAVSAGEVLSGESGSVESDLTEVLSECGQARVGSASPWFAGWTHDNLVFNIRKPFIDGSRRRLVLAFWASWCLPCRKGLARLNAAFDSLDQSGVAVVMVNVGETGEEVRAFIKANAPRFPVVLDPFKISVESFLKRPDGRVTLPLTVVIDSKGMIRGLMGAEGEDYIRRLLEY